MSLLNPTILNHALRYLSLRPRTIQEMHSYLFKKSKNKDNQWTKEEIQTIITHLKEENELNDMAFIDWYVQARPEKKYKSTFALTRELTSRGISDQLIQEYFSTHPLNEHEQAYQLLQKKWHTYQHEEKQKKYQKASRFLASKGYSYDIIRNAIARMEKKR